MQVYNVEEPKLGIILYRETGVEDLSIPSRLEETLKDSDHEFFQWKKAVVGYNEEKPDYRDCVDLKISQKHWQYIDDKFIEIKNCYDEYNFILQQCLNDYEKRFNFTMEYMEAINFVRYGEGQHFAVHTDDGFSYSCTLSSVGWFNDDYDGGELWFPYMNLKFKPVKGDILFFPSTYIFAHASLPVNEGIKYSAVTMFDYNDRTHNLDTSTNTPKNTGDTYGSASLTRIDS